MLTSPDTSLVLAGVLVDGDGVELAELLDVGLDDELVDALGDELDAALGVASSLAPLAMPCAPVWPADEPGTPAADGDGVSDALVDGGLDVLADGVVPGV